jgi:hypothetical protein
MDTLPLREDWEILLRFLPEGWEAKASELGALVRKRKIDSAQTLLRLLLIHLADGKSLRTTSAYAQEAKISNINDVALLHRLKASERWFLWMSQELLKGLKGPYFPERLSMQFQVRLVDGTSISEPGSTGTDWRLHYCLRLATLRCDAFTLTDPKIGEDFQRYSVAPGDLLVGDRGYCKRRGISHVLDSGGQVLVRFHSSNLPLLTYQGKPFATLEHLRSLEPGRHGDWDVWYQSPDNERLIKGRLCAIKKSREAIELAKNKLRTKASRQQRQLLPETLEYAEYVSLFTTVNRHGLKAEDILSLYRGRWQIELVFKRLKGIIGIGHLPKYNPESCIAWLHGKVFLTLLVERLYQEAEFFSPWGYPLDVPRSEPNPTQNRWYQKPVEGI